MMNIDIYDLITKVLIEILTFVLIFCGVTVVATIVTTLAGAYGVKVVCFSILLFVYIFIDKV